MCCTINIVPLGVSLRSSSTLGVGQWKGDLCDLILYMTDEEMFCISFY